jgi:cyclic lactone autoinducer peptide
MKKMAARLAGAVLASIAVIAATTGSLVFIHRPEAPKQLKK